MISILTDNTIMLEQLVLEDMDTLCKFYSGDVRTFNVASD